MVKNEFMMDVKNVPNASCAAPTSESHDAFIRFRHSEKQAGTDQIAINDSVQRLGRPSGRNQLAVRRINAAGSTRLRRRLSKIFNHETSEIGLATGPRLFRNAGEQPAGNLPVAAQPAMLAPVVGAVVRGIVVDHLDIADQAGARVGAFDQVVAEQGVAREASIEYLMNGVDLVDAFAGEDAFAVQILIDVRDRAGVDIEAGLTRVDGGEAGSACFAH